MGVPMAHFYHVYASGNWKFIYDLHYSALADSGLLDALSGNFFVGIVGTDSERQDAIEYFATKPLQPKIAVEKESGWEQETLDAAHEFAKNCQEETYILYAHTKGASYDTEEKDSSQPWRYAMTYWSVTQWERAVSSLTDGSHMAGPHWMAGQPGQQHYFGGNFWWAKSSFLSALDPCTRRSRWCAEEWVGLSVFKFKEIVVTNLFPGAIGEVSTPERIAERIPVTGRFYAR